MIINSRQFIIDEQEVNNQMEVKDLFINGISITSIITLLLFIICLCIKPLRSKLIEFIILKHDKPLCEQQLKLALEQINILRNKMDEQSDKIDILTQENNQLKCELLEMKILIGKKVSKR